MELRSRWESECGLAGPEKRRGHGKGIPRKVRNLPGRQDPIQPLFKETKAFTTLSASEVSQNGKRKIPNKQDYNICKICNRNLDIFSGTGWEM